MKLLLYIFIVSSHCTSDMLIISPCMLLGCVLTYVTHMPTYIDMYPFTLRGVHRDITLETRNYGSPKTQITVSPIGFYSSSTLF